MSGDGRRLGRVLPEEAISALADLVAAGYGISAALEVLPRRALKPAVVQRLESEVAELQAGGALDLALERLGLEITPAVLRGSQSHSADIEAALRADVEARTAAAAALRKTRSGVQLFGIIVGGMALFTFILAFFLVPGMIKGVAGLAQGSELPPSLVRFEQFRDTWLALGAGFLLAMTAPFVIYSGIVGRSEWRAFLQDFRLYLPFLRRHAIAASSARLLEAVAHEEAAGIPTNLTLRRVQRREPVPRLRNDLGLAATRLEAGDSWEACLRGTLFDTPVLADLASLASRGARPTQGWRWAAARNRDEAVKSLRRAIVAAAVVVFVPSFLYILVLMNAAAVTSSVAQFEALRQQVELLTDEVEEMFQNVSPQR
jgi:type II secretory pathway component PulF